MANNTRDETIRLDFQATGDDQLASIAKGLAEIGEGSTEAAPKARELFDQLARLANQAGQAEALVALKAELQETGDALFLAKQNAAGVRAEFDATLEPSAALTRQLAKADAQVVSLDSRYMQLTTSIALNTNVLQANGFDTERLDALQRQLGAALAASKTDAQEFAAGLKEASAAGKEEAATLGEVVEKTGFLRKAVEQVRDLLVTFAGLFVLEKVKEDIGEILESGDKFARFGVDFANAFGGAKEGQEALAKVKELAEETPLSLDEVAAAALRAKKVGLDPLNGTLLALIDANAKYGGSNATLTTLIDTLGKAYNKGELNARQLVAIQEQGIPVTKILGEALGKTGDEVLDLAKKGELGKDSIKLLIDQLGAGAVGDAKTQMGLLSTLVTKFKDEFDEFLNLIGESGAYDYAKQKLSEINAAIKQGLADGSLKEKAEAISNAIVNFGKAVSATAKFIFDHAGAIYEAGKAYVVLRTSMVALDLAGVALRFTGLTTAVTTNTLATGAAAVTQRGYADALKATDAAAIAASAEGGALSRLGGVLSKIPRSILIGVAVAIAEKDIELAIDLYDNTIKLRDANRQLKEQTEDYRSELTVMASKAEAVAVRFAGFAKTQIADADTLAAKNRSQTQDYIQQLQNATRYYNALKIQARAIGDDDGVKSFTPHLRDLSLAMADAAEHLKQVADSVAHTSEAVGTVVDKFDQLRTNGEAAASAIQNGFAHIEIRTPQGLEDTLAVIRQISIRSPEAATAVRAELANELAKLDAIDLRNFQDNVTKKIEAAGKASQEATVAIQASLQAELLQLGLSAQQASVEFTASGQKIIDTFGNIVANAAVSGDKIQLAFAKALSSASTQGEVEALQKELQGAFDAGKIGVDKFEAASQAAGRRLAEVQVAAVEAGAALDGMGTNGTTAAQRISGALQDTRDKLVVQLNQIAAAVTAAMQAGDDPKQIAELGAQFKSVDAQVAALNARIAKLNSEIEATAAAGLNAGKQLGQGIADADKLLGDHLSSAQHNTENLERSVTDFGDAAAEAALKTQGITADTSNANAAMNQLSDTAAKTYGKFKDISQAAADLDEKITLDLSQHLETAFGPSGETSGFDAAYQAIADGAAKVDEQIARQREQLNAEIDSINQLGNDGKTNFGFLGNSATEAAKRAAELSAQIANGTYNAGLLGQQELQPLQAALDAATQRARSLAEAEKAATQQLTDLNDQLQDQLDQDNGDKAAQENRSYLKQKQNIEDLAKTADAAGKAQAAEAIKKLDDLHQRTLKKIADELVAQNNATDAAATHATGGDSQNASNSGSSSTSALPASTNRSTALRPVVHMNYFTIDNKQLGPFVADPETARQMTNAVLATIVRARQTAFFGR